MLGVLGGMGPAATVDFLGKLVRATPATNDQDHIPVVVWDDPRVPDRTDAVIGGGVDPTPALTVGARALVTMGARAIAVPCNTAHLFLPKVAAITGARFLDMVLETCQQVDADLPAGESVGLLAGTGAVRADLYARPMAARQRPMLTPDPADQDRVMLIIRAVKAGVITADIVAELHGVVERLRADGAVAVIAACTELPLVLCRDPRSPLPVFDPTELLAQLAARTFHPDPVPAMSASH